MELPERLHISRRLKEALIADLVLQDLGSDGDALLKSLPGDETEWTEHLGRQLGMQMTYDVDRSIHETLLEIVKMLEDEVREWPPRHDATTCRDITHRATKYLRPEEAYATLLAGPKHWLNQRIDAGCAVGRLDVHLRSILEKGLAAQLNHVLEKWIEWDVPRLATKRRMAAEVAEAAARTAAHAAATESRERMSATERRERPVQLYQPPGRT